MMSNQSKVSLIKEIYGINTYSKVIDTEFREFVTAIQDSNEIELTIEEFFQQYERLFFDIPIDGETNSHKYMIARSQQFVGADAVGPDVGPVIDRLTAQLFRGHVVRGARVLVEFAGRVRNRLG